MLRELTLPLAVALASPFGFSEPVSRGDPDPPNFVIVLIDDAGVDLLAAYGEHDTPAKTPTIDALALDGVLFRNAYSAPVCSPARAMLMTGLQSRRTGIGYFNAKNSPTAVELNERFETIPEMLGSGYARGCFGKWHLTTRDVGAMHVLDSGFDQHQGVGWGVVNGCSLPMPHRGDYFDYCIFVNGTSVDGEFDHRSTYNTINTTNNAIAFITDSVNAQRPFLAYVPYQAPHSPFQAPPDALLCDETIEAIKQNEGDPAILVRAMLEALDKELGRLLASVPMESTYVFLIGDNGTAKAATLAPFDSTHAKGTTYEGGINVPFIVTGPTVAQGESAALVSITDVFSTVAALASKPPGPATSISLVPYLVNPNNTPSIRNSVYVEAFRPNYEPVPPIPTGYQRFEQAARDSQYKLIRKLVGSGSPKEEFYDLLADPFETGNLLPVENLLPDELMSYRTLSAALPLFPRGAAIVQ